MTTGDQWQAPSPTGDGREARLGPEDTVERRITWWQRALRWAAWLTFLGLAVYNSQSVYFSPLEWLALIAAIGISIWCMAKPLGGPKYELRESTHLLGAFVSRTNWGLALFGGILTIGGVAGAMAAIYDVSTGRATVGEVVKDIGIFIEGWIAELIAPADGPPAVVLPQDRVFSREYGVRLPDKVSAGFFRRLLAGRGFDVESASSSSNSFTARRK
jgi:hypothetical protein